MEEKKILLPMNWERAANFEQVANDDMLNVAPKNILDDISLAVQVNGKTRDVINIKKDMDEKSINKIIYQSSKAKKHLDQKKVVKTIFVKNRIINFIVAK